MLFLCCLSLVFITVFAGPIDQIVAGSAASLCEFPSIVHLKIYNQPRRSSYVTCGGTLIDPTHVLTAAHCLDGPVKTISVNIGTNNKNKYGDQSSITNSFVKHAGYVLSEYVIKNDIAILRLTKSIKPDSCVQFAPLAQAGETFDHARCIAAGWGDLGWQQKSPSKLQKVALPAIPTDVCQYNSRMVISDGVLCAGDFRKGGPSTCQGDSGGPLYCPSKITGQMVLAGVTSFGDNCDNEISAFSSVAYFRDWIANNL
ncbi:chymotrypsin-1 [Octopus bimaculoides]|uniref:Peptidase S1 domain-containing protein n=1 Tax=Octopus bimaculoides TaxID=37653 RepID=A0A0L8H265_OCTBM|nr:chymotrypsin-1 [Octopus bimaculoides]|eukprot:XP_014776000.1 PREDICTED: chymotrypsin-1-like [Octopus bimaculoides]